MNSKFKFNNQCWLTAHSKYIADKSYKTTEQEKTEVIIFMHVTWSLSSTNAAIGTNTETEIFTKNNDLQIAFLECHSNNGDEQNIFTRRKRNQKASASNKPWNGWIIRIKNA